MATFFQMNQVTQWLDLSQVYNSRAYAAQILNRDQLSPDRLRTSNIGPESNLLPQCLVQPGPAGFTALQ